jgi:hypothetical protein
MEWRHKSHHGSRLRTRVTNVTIKCCRYTPYSANLTSVETTAGRTDRTFRYRSLNSSIIDGMATQITSRISAAYSSQQCHNGMLPLHTIFGQFDQRREASGLNILVFILEQLDNRWNGGTNRIMKLGCAFKSIRKTSNF